MSGNPVVRRGVAASAGIALGYVHLLDPGLVSLPKKKISRAEVEPEVARFDRALSDSREQLQKIRAKFSEEQGEEHLYLIEAQLLMLDDRSLTDGAREAIRDQAINAEWALEKAVGHFKEMFDRIDDEYFRDRRSDIEYVEERLLRAMAGSRGQEYVSLQRQSVIVAPDLSPMDMVKISRENLSAFVTDRGGRTSHTVIIARSLGMPMVVGLTDLSLEARSGDRIIVDGGEGLVILHPDTKTWSEYEDKRRKFLRTQKELLKNRHHKAETRDQYRVRLMANIDFQEEIPSVLANGAEGIGILRTEHLFLGGSVPVSEEEHFANYRKVAEKMKPHETVVRLLDLAGDQLFAMPSSDYAAARSPALGIRGIRLLIKEKEIFRPQIRAVLRASAFGKMAVLYPMVSSVEEVREANAFLRQVAEDLKRENVKFDPDMRKGCMIEIPSAALTADVIAQEVDFLSIGTNDLLQYTVAAERGNELVAHVYEPLHRGMLQLLAQVVKMGHAAGREVGVCGEVAGEPFFAPLLVGLEVNFLSMNAGAIPSIKQVIREVSLTEAKKWAAEVIGLDTAREIRARLSAWYSKGFADISA